MLADLWVGRLIEDLENTGSDKFFATRSAGQGSHIVFNVAKISIVQIFNFHTQQAHTKYMKNLYHTKISRYTVHVPSVWESTSSSHTHPLMLSAHATSHTV